MNKDAHAEVMGRFVSVCSQQNGKTSKVWDSQQNIGDKSGRKEKDDLGPSGSEGEN